MDKSISFETKFDENFTIGEILTIKAIETVIETGRYEKASYDLLVVLDDEAGITFGKNQTTENSGGLHKLLTIYLEDTSLKNKMFADQIRPYMSKLFDGKDRSKKFALTKDTEFHSLLVEASRRDRDMREAQRKHFHNNFFRPMYEAALDWNVTLPLGLMVFYDMGIQSGPEFAKHLINEFDKTWKPPAKFDVDGDGFVDDKEFTEDEEIELQEAWISGLIDYRLNWLVTYKNNRNPKKTLVVRRSSYRMYALQHYAYNKNFHLELPLAHKNIHTYGRDTPYIKTTQLTEELIREVELM